MNQLDPSPIVEGDGQQERPRGTAAPAPGGKDHQTNKAEQEKEVH